MPRPFRPSSPGAAETSSAPVANHHGITRKYDERRKSAAGAGIFVVKILDGFLLTLRRPAILTLIIALTSIFFPAPAQHAGPGGRAGRRPAGRGIAPVSLRLHDGHGHGAGPRGRQAGGRLR